MRILLLAPHPYYVDRGTPIDVDILLRALSVRGAQVDAVTYRDGEDREYPGLTIHRAQTPRWLAGTTPGFSFKKILADLYLFFRTRKLLKQYKYDVIHANEEAVFFAMWFQAWRGIPYIYDMDSSIAQQLIEKMPWLRPLAPVFNWCEARAIRGALATAPVCNALAELAHRRGARHVVTLHDISQMSPDDFVIRDSIRPRFGIRGTILMYVGNLEAYQGVDLLLEAFSCALRESIDTILVVAGGTAAQIEAYQAKASCLGIADRTHFIGPWPASRLGGLLAQADIVTAPRTRGINTPMKVFPYLHSGKAVLVTEIYSHTQILTDSICDLALPEPVAFAEAIIRLARDPERRRRLGENGRRFVERNHCFSAHLRRVDELYNHVEGKLKLASSAVEARTV